jgi:peptide/nickel transport system permease protein
MPEPHEPIQSAVQPLPVLPDEPSGSLMPSQSFAPKARSPWEIAWIRFRRHKLAIAGLIVLGLMILLALAAPLIARYITHTNYSHQDLSKALEGPSGHHYFGTDNEGRDMFIRTLYGGRISLVVGVCVAIFSGVIGTVVGALAGFYGKWVDSLLMRVTDLFLSIPFLVVLILVVNIFSGSIFDIVLILSLFFWMPNARILRGVVLSLKEKEFVEAARSVGASNKRIIVQEILPNAVGPIIVILTLGVAQAIITESALSFLGFGVQPPVPTWGNLLSASRGFIQIAPWMVWFPGLLILLTVLAINVVGDGLRDALDPFQEIRSKE